MNTLNLFTTLFTIIDMHDKDPKEGFQNPIEKLNSNNSFDNTTMDSQTLDLFKNFSLSNYEDDDSAVCCPCCLPR